MPVQPLGAVEQEVKGELELKLLIAPAADAGQVAVGGRRRDGQDVRVLLSELVCDPLQYLRAEGLRCFALRFGLRTLEAAFIAVGIVSLLAVVTLRQQASADAAWLVGVGQGLVAVHNWTFLLGPNFVCAADTFVLAWLMWRSQLISRLIAGLGLVGGPVLFLSATAVLFGAYKQVSLPGAVAPLPVFAWELGLALFLIFKGFRTTSLDQRETARISYQVVG